MPLASSSWMPTQDPSAKSTDPTYCTVAVVPFHVTFCPTETPSTDDVEAGAATPAGAAAGAGAAGAAAPCTSSGLQKMPRFGAHEKYFFPNKLPSCMPLSASNATPTHSPAAKPTLPTYCTMPDVPFHETCAPTAMPDTDGEDDTACTGAATPSIASRSKGWQNTP